jgi:small subunit ribosomal protein S16
VVAEHTTARDGRFIATLGHYNPRPKDTVLAVNADQVKYWLEKGATPTDTVRSLLKKAGVYGGAERAGGKAKA